MTRLAFEHCGNKEYLRVHLEVRPPKIPWLSIDKTTKEGEELKAALLSIPGIKNEIQSFDYSITLQRGGVFSWDELKPEIIKVLSKFFNVSFTIVEAYPSNQNTGNTDSIQQQDTDNQS